jgi:hypothetical protein
MINSAPFSSASRIAGIRSVKVLVLATCISMPAALNMGITQSAPVSVSRNMTGLSAPAISLSRMYSIRPIATWVAV